MAQHYRPQNRGLRGLGVFLFLGLCNAAVAGPATQQSGASDDPVAVLRSMQLDGDKGLTAAGHAKVVQALNGGEEIPSEVAFWLSDGAGRSEIIFKPTQSGQTPYANVKVIEKPGRAMLYTPGPPQLVEITAPQAISWTDELGSDFRPHAFLVIRGVPLEKWRSGVIKNLEDGHSEGKVVRRPDGHVVVQTHFKEKPGSDKLAILSMELDPAAGMRMVRFLESVQNVNGEGTSMDTDYRIEWKQYGGHWYPKSVSYEGKSAVLDGPPPAQHFSESRKVTVDDLDVSAKTSEEDFQIETFGAPHARIRDELPGDKGGL